MASPSIEARFCAYARIQAIQAKYTPGSRRFEQAEHALDLALSETRTIDRFLLRNLLRDSKRVLSRQSAARRYVDLPAEGESSCFEEGRFGDPTNPEALLEANQLAEAVAVEVGRSSSHAVRVMEGLITGETLGETARATGISAARITQLRRAIRVATTKFEASLRD
ncbi:hypothetical protein E8F11_11225 [Pseudomonas sp. BN417]|uniref:hypothetical protein n=1 Tax=Pseudomonas sp. BN417 TaxID=2567890 RepID=UPI002456635D|nr:hypothetical protein [Pseudomonas sp. BN417]MDH4555736.1 hypothetical protein [Pseudomonas sp. BN417]